MQFVFLFVWIIILLIISHPSFKKSIDMEIKIPQRSVIKEHNSFTKIMFYGYTFSLSLICGMFVFGVLHNNGLLNSVIEFFKNVWPTSILSIVYPALNKKNKAWSVVLIILSIVLCITLDQEKSDKFYLKYSVMLSLLVTFVVVAIMIPLFSNSLSKKRKIKKGVWRDLYYRKSNIICNYNDEFELSRSIERLFITYLEKYKKLKNVKSIEYVTLRKTTIDESDRKDYWYKKGSFAIKILMISLAFYNVRMLLLFENVENILCILEIIIILVIIYYMKKNDYEYLKLIGLRYFYDDWGYYITTDKKYIFVSLEQMIHISKYKNYIKSLLDLLAVFRCIQQIDIVKKTNLVNYISQDVLEIVSLCNDSNEWKSMLPIWVLTYIQYEKNGYVACKSKDILSRTVSDKEERANLCITLQSILANYYRKEPNCEDRWKLKVFLDYTLN